MKILLLIISFAFLSVSSDTRIENTTLSPSDEFAVEYNTDFYENVIGEIHDHEIDSEECMCCNCDTYEVSCCYTVTTQWCENCFHGSLQEWLSYICFQTCQGT